MITCVYLSFFFFKDTATTEIYTLSLHDALPICWWPSAGSTPAQRLLIQGRGGVMDWRMIANDREKYAAYRSEEHTSELQSQSNLVCRLLLEKKKKKSIDITKNILYM